MTRNELLKKLREIGENPHDPEEAHLAADELLLEFINDDEITAAYNKIEKWYA